MADCVKTLMSVQHQTSAHLPLPVSILAGHFTVTVAAASSLITPSVMTLMSVWRAVAVPMQHAQIHLVPSLASAQQGTGEMALPVWMWKSARWLNSATQMPFALIFLDPTTAPVGWVILEMG